MPKPSNFGWGSGKRYEDDVKKARFAGDVCGATLDELPEDIEGIQRLATAQVKVAYQRMGEFRTKVEHRFVLKTRLYLEFGRYESALECIQSAEVRRDHR